ncbi:unnamed protein product [Amoebophrya sp. A120]|nr:unnamed protein product [Amoebophrya sp. A120]|eukprot:GSA120T00001173001.1
MAEDLHDAVAGADEILFSPGIFPDDEGDEEVYSFSPQQKSPSSPPALHPSTTAYEIALRRQQNRVLALQNTKRALRISSTSPKRSRAAAEADEASDEVDAGKRFLEKQRKLTEQLLAPENFAITEEVVLVGGRSLGKINGGSKTSLSLRTSKSSGSAAEVEVEGLFEATASGAAPGHTNYLHDVETNPGSFSTGWVQQSLQPQKILEREAFILRQEDQEVDDLLVDNYTDGTRTHQRLVNRFDRVRGEGENAGEQVAAFPMDIETGTTTTPFGGPLASTANSSSPAPHAHHDGSSSAYLFREGEHTRNDSSPENYGNFQKTTSPPGGESGSYGEDQEEADVDQTQVRAGNTNSKNVEWDFWTIPEGEAIVPEGAEKESSGTTTDYALDSNPPPAGEVVILVENKESEPAVNEDARSTRPVAAMHDGVNMQPRPEQAVPQVDSVAGDATASTSKSTRGPPVAVTKPEAEQRGPPASVEEGQGSSTPVVLDRNLPSAALFAANAKTSKSSQPDSKKTINSDTNFLPTFAPLEQGLTKSVDSSVKSLRQNFVAELRKETAAVLEQPARDERQIQLRERTSFSLLQQSLVQGLQERLSTSAAGRRGEDRQYSNIQIAQSLTSQSKLSGEDYEEDNGALTSARTEISDELAAVVRTGGSVVQYYEDKMSSSANSGAAVGGVVPNANASMVVPGTTGNSEDNYYGYDEYGQQYTAEDWENYYNEQQYNEYNYADGQDNYEQESQQDPSNKLRFTSTRLPSSIYDADGEIPLSTIHDGPQRGSFSKAPGSKYRTTGRIKHPSEKPETGFDYHQHFGQHDGNNHTMEDPFTAFVPEDEQLSAELTLLAHKGTTSKNKVEIGQSTIHENLRASPQKNPHAKLQVHHSGRVPSMKIVSPGEGEGEQQNLYVDGDEENQNVQLSGQQELGTSNQFEEQTARISTHDHLVFHVEDENNFQLEETPIQLPFGTRQNFAKIGNSTIHEHVRASGARHPEPRVQRSVVRTESHKPEFEDEHHVMHLHEPNTGLSGDLAITGFGDLEGHLIPHEPVAYRSSRGPASSMRSSSLKQLELELLQGRAAGNEDFSSNIKSYKQNRYLEEGDAGPATTSDLEVEEDSRSDSERAQELQELLQSSEDAEERASSSRSDFAAASGGFVQQEGNDFNRFEVDEEDIETELTPFAGVVEKTTEHSIHNPLSRAAASAHPEQKSKTFPPEQRKSMKADEHLPQSAVFSTAHGVIDEDLSNYAKPHPFADRSPVLVSAGGSSNFAVKELDTEVEGLAENEPRVEEDEDFYFDDGTNQDYYRAGQSTIYDQLRASQNRHPSAKVQKGMSIRVSSNKPDDKNYSDWLTMYEQDGVTEQIHFHTKTQLILAEDYDKFSTQKQKFEAVGNSTIYDNLRASSSPHPERRTMKTRSSSSSAMKVDSMKGVPLEVPAAPGSSFGGSSSADRMTRASAAEHQNNVYFHTDEHVLLMPEIDEVSAQNLNLHFTKQQKLLTVSKQTKEEFLIAKREEELLANIRKEKYKNPLFPRFVTGDTLTPRTLMQQATARKLKQRTFIYDVEEELDQAERKAEDATKDKVGLTQSEQLAKQEQEKRELLWGMNANGTTAGDHINDGQLALQVNPEEAASKSKRDKGLKSRSRSPGTSSPMGIKKPASLLNPRRSKSNPASSRAGALIAAPAGGFRFNFPEAATTATQLPPPEAGPGTAPVAGVVPSPVLAGPPGAFHLALLNTTILPPKHQSAALQQSRSRSRSPEGFTSSAAVPNNFIPLIQVDPLPPLQQFDERFLLNAAKQLPVSQRFGEVNGHVGAKLTELHGHDVGTYYNYGAGATNTNSNSNFDATTSKNPEDNNIMGFDTPRTIIKKAFTTQPDLAATIYKQTVEEILTASASSMGDVVLDSNAYALYQGGAAQVGDGISPRGEQFVPAQFYSAPTSSSPSAELIASQRFLAALSPAGTTSGGPPAGSLQPQQQGTSSAGTGTTGTTSFQTSAPPKGNLLLSRTGPQANPFAHIWAQYNGGEESEMSESEVELPPEDDEILKPLTRPPVELPLPNLLRFNF